MALTTSSSAKAPFLLQSNPNAQPLIPSKHSFNFQFWLCEYSHAIAQYKRAIMTLLCGSSGECVAWLALQATETKDGILSQGLMHMISATKDHGRDHAHILVV
jgi:hypothetical protein